MKRDNKGKNFVAKIALERIYRLFELADAEKDKTRTKRYVELARKIATRNRVRIPQELKKKFCKKCGAFLKQGVNSKIRVTKSYLCVTCKECENVKKISLKAFK
ncbi:MAG: ribonuclease P [Candidatus Diapherotrites archaeon]